MVSSGNTSDLSSNRRKLLYGYEFVEINSSSRKRKLEEEKSQQQTHDDQEVNSKKMFPSTHDDMRSIFHTTPSPLDWQRCLDIKSGQIYFYNTRTQERTTSRGPITSLETPISHSHMSLDLELNLPCGSLDNSGKISDHISGSGPVRSPSWVNFEGDDNKQDEMVTTVCNKCHMLVMMFKSSPSCPNCKFIYPPDQSPPNMFNTRTLSLLC